MKTLFSLFCGLLACSVGTAQAMPPQPLRLAVAIGISAYGSGRALANPTLDAARVRDGLKEVGYDATAYTNVSSSGFRTELASLRARIRTLPANSTVLIYYAGHGFNIEGKSYLAPVDFNFASLTKGNPEGSLISVSDLVMSASVRPDVHSIVVIDACRELVDMRKLSTRVGAFSEPVSPPNVMMIYASQAGTSAADGVAGEGSPLARAIIYALKQPSADATIFSQNVTAKVKNISVSQQVVVKPPTSPFGNIFTPSDSGLFCANCYLTKLSNEKKYEELFRATLKRAQDGDAEAMKWVSQMYANPSNWNFSKEIAVKLLGKPRDFPEGLRWARLAARAGAPDGVNNWASLAWTSTPEHPSDLQDMIAAYEYGYKNGDQESAFHLGCIYWLDSYGLVDFPRAVFYYEKSLEAYNCCGAINLAAILIHGKPGVPQDRKRASELYQMAADRGNVMGWIGLATIAEEDKNYSAQMDALENAIATGDHHGFYAYAIALWRQVDRTRQDEGGQSRLKIEAFLTRARDIAKSENLHDTGKGTRDPSTNTEAYTVEFYQATLDNLQRSWPKA